MTATTSIHLLYFASSSHGGLADYAREQVSALARRGVGVELVCAPSFPVVATEGVKRVDCLLDTPKRHVSTGKLRRAVGFARHAITNHRRLASRIRQGRHERVLFAAYGEYFAPIWAPAMRQLTRSGVQFGAVVHDPVRDAVLGPVSWHRRSVAAAYSFLRHAFVHEAIELDTVQSVPGMKTTVIPHGPFRLKTSAPTREQARRNLRIPAEVKLLLAFGHIRDNKNLDLTIEALGDIPDLHLIVAGSSLSSNEKPAEFYRDLAREHGVDGRCHWHIRHIPESEVGTFFAAADFVSLTYGAGFRSASGVLNVAAQFHKPCIASSGPGPLKRLVHDYRLGLWVEPDDAQALGAGLKELVSISTEPRWNEYERDNSWDENARIVAETMFANNRE